MVVVQTVHEMISSNSVSSFEGRGHERLSARDERNEGDLQEQFSPLQGYSGFPKTESSGGSNQAGCEAPALLA